MSPNFNENKYFYLATVFTSLSLLAGHWFPWNYFLNSKLPRIAAYAYGSLSVWGGFSIWRLLDKDKVTPGGLWWIYFWGGASVCGAYLIDWLAIKAAKANQDEQLVK